jgi:hypothetical protein
MMDFIGTDNTVCHAQTIVKTAYLLLHASNAGTVIT